jgi:dUTP pyrophosphatase
MNIQTDNGIRVKVKFLDDAALVYGGNGDGLAYATPDSAGLDLRACIAETALEIGPGQRAKVPAGIAIEPCSPGVAGFVLSRSGLGAKDGLTVAQGVGCIDPDYRGQIVVWLLNTSSETRRVARGQRIAQLVFLPVLRAQLEFVDQLAETDRGAGGFGHTGKM